MRSPSPMTQICNFQCTCTGSVVAAICVPHAPAEHWTFLENVQHVLDFSGITAQYGESFSLNLCSPQSPFATAKPVIVRCRLLGGRRACELVRTLVSRDSGMRSNPNKRTALPATISEMSRLGPEGDRSSGRPTSGGPGVTENVDQPVFTILHPPYRPLQRDHLRDRVVASSTTSLPSRHSVRAAPTLPSIRLPSVKMRGPTTARRSTVWGRGPRRSRTRFGRARVRQIAEIHGSLELPVDKVSPKSFRA
ncbi:hypothetical protein EVAR_84210_1 [Eumeta japonica]|uniref:Uncharacterized protein n=1 Tax=Eumeta variegata TaxID=151549 RepID=A0A4C1SB96_EUMVA|nr:hypothetical protein EVAR_84210_1 [Eumeta japonica]